MKASLKASLIAVAIATIPLGSLAAGLGQINVASGLGQPLRAEIPLHVTPQELQSLSARIASVEAFRQASIPYSAAASSVRVAVDPRGGQPVIRLSSQRPVNDPFIELLVELNWSSGQLLRQYTFLLDPVDLVTPKPLAADIKPPVAAPRVVSAAPARTPNAGAAVPAVAETSHTVRKGETLHRIAGALAPPGVNLDQMLVGLLRANPTAFDEGNINRLRSGVILSVPSAARVAAIDAGEARREILAQASDFEAYRRRLAGVASSRETAAVAGQTSGGQIVPKVEETRSRRPAGDQLQVSRNDAGGRNDAAAQLQVLEEELVAREKALADAASRIGQLEQSVRSMQSLLELRGKLPLPSQAQPAAGAGTAAAPAAVAAPATPPASDTAAPAPAESASLPAASSAAAAMPDKAEQSPPESAAAAAPEPAPVPPVAEDSAFDDALLADLTLVGAGLAVVALLLAYIALRRRRLNQARAHADELAAFEPLMSAPPMQQEIIDKTVMTEAGEPRAEPGNAELMTSFKRAPVAALDDGEGVDPVAEAEVYMAYGRDAQAVEILLDAMRTDPGRTTIHVKLLEIYAQHKSPAEFETVARLLHARTGGKGSDWVRAALLGSQLDPANPLYGRSPAAATAPAAVAAPAAMPEPVRRPAVSLGSVSSAMPATPRPAPARPVPAVAQAPDDRTGQSLSALDFTASQPFDESFSHMKATWVLPGQTAQYGNMSDPTAAPSELPGVTMAPPLESGEVQAAGTSNVIDFDLGLDDMPSKMADEPTLPALDTPAPSTTLDMEPGTRLSGDAPATEGLVFDLDLGGAEDVPSKLPLQPAAPAAAGEAPPTAMFDLDFDLPRVGNEQSVGAGQAEAGLNPYTLAPDPDTTRPADSELQIGFKLDFPPAVDASAAPEPGEFTLAPFDAPGKPVEVPTRVAEAAAASTLVADATADDLETRLQLVRVYDEMGDREAALALLDEIVREVGLGQPEVRKLIVRLG